MLKTSTTGSYPPLFNPTVGLSALPAESREDLVHKSIAQAIRDQIDLQIDILVDGQPRDDIVSMFTHKLTGYQGAVAGPGDAMMPKRIVGRIRPAEEPITVADYCYARDLAGTKPLKAHITGPITIARSSFVEPESPYCSRHDERLIQDLAFALGREASALVKAGAEVVQIDEPLLASTEYLDMAFAAMRMIVETGHIPHPALHACGNIPRVFEQIMRKSPVEIVSLEGSWLLAPELKEINGAYLVACRKKLGLGCIQVNSRKVESPLWLQVFLEDVLDRVGEDSIWAVMPNCGMRLLDRDVAKRKLQVMVQVVRAVRGEFHWRPS